MDAFVWIFVCIGIGLYPYLPGSNTTWGEVKTTLCSGFNKLGLWATMIYQHDPAQTSPTPLKLNLNLPPT